MYLRPPEILVSRQDEVVRTNAQTEERRPIARSHKKAVMCRKTLFAVALYI